MERFAACDQNYFEVVVRRSNELGPALTSRVVHRSVHEAMLISNIQQGD
jgi:hypothetical protein